MQYIYWWILIILYMPTNSLKMPLLTCCFLFLIMGADSIALRAKSSEPAICSYKVGYCPPGYTLVDGTSCIKPCKTGYTATWVYPIGYFCVGCPEGSTYLAGFVCTSPSGNKHMEHYLTPCLNGTAPESRQVN